MSTLTRENDLDALVAFVRTRTENLNPRDFPRMDTEQIWYEDDPTDVSKVFDSEDSKESTPIHINWEQECARLGEQLHALTQEMETQLEAHDHISQKLRHRNYALETACQNLEQELMRRRTIQDDLQHRLHDMHEEKHHLQVRLREFDMLKPQLSTGLLTEEPCVEHVREEPWEPSIQIVQQQDSVSREEIIKIMWEHKKELREKANLINSLETDLKNWIAENRKLISANVNLEEAERKLAVELDIKIEKLQEKSHMIYQTNSRLDAAYSEATLLKEEIKFLKTQNSKLKSKVRSLRGKGSLVRTLTDKSLQRLDDDILVINNYDKFSQDSFKDEGSDGIAKDDDSIKSNYGSLAWGVENFEEDELEILSQHSEHSLKNLLVEFAQHTSWEAREVAASSYATSSRSEFCVPRMQSWVMSGSTNRWKDRSDISTLGLGGIKNSFFSIAQDTNFQVKYSRKKKEASASKPTSGWDLLLDWKWAIPTSFIIMTTLIYIMNLRATDRRRYSIRRRRAVS